MPLLFRIKQAGRHSVRVLWVRLIGGANGVGVSLVKRRGPRSERDVCSLAWPHSQHSVHFDEDMLFLRILYKCATVTDTIEEVLGVPVVRH